jgi:hypothetical protein
MVLCPCCKINPTVRKPGRGRTPACVECRKSRGDPKHYDKNGVRFGTPGRVVVRTCKYCGVAYARGPNDFQEPVCPSHAVLHVSLVGPLRKQRKAETPHRKPDYRAQRRLLAKLQKLGLSIEWFNTQGDQCGICRTTKPGGRGNWHIDHDHKCCAGTPRGGGDAVGCPKCVRGILCNSCNSGLPHFRDDPDLLRTASSWVSNASSRGEASGRCGICKTVEPGGHGYWNRDHDHKCCKRGCSKCIRGILCYYCNMGLGHFKDDPKRLLAAIAWVQKVPLQN